METSSLRSVIDPTLSALNKCPFADKSNKSAKNEKRKIFKIKICWINT